MNRQFLRSGAATLAILVFAAVVSACGGGGKPQRVACPAGQTCLEYGNTGDPTSLDPQKVSLVNEAVIVRALDEGLYQDGPGGEAEFGLATSAETSADGLTWTFHLRDAKWSDGQPVTARDFVYSFGRILDPKTASNYAYLVQILVNGELITKGKLPPSAVGAEAPDPHTLVLHLVHPASYLPQLLKHQAFYPVPEHVVRRWGDSEWVKPGHYVGAGAYTLTDYRLGDYVRVQKNPLYYDAAHVCLDRIDFLPLSDAVAAERRVRRGEIDVSDTIQSSKVAFLRQPDQIPQYVHTHVYLATSYVIFNTHNPALARRNVRQAISMTIDRDFITAKLMRAGQIPTYSFVPPGMAGYVPDGERPKPAWVALNFQQRQAEARRLLALEGYGPNHPLKFELKVSNTTDGVLIAQALQADWATIGIDASLRQEETQIAFSDFNVRDFDVGLVSWILDFDDPMTFLGLMKSDTGAQNYGDFRSAAYDALLNRADQEPDGAKRALILRQAEQMIIDDADIAPVYNGVNRNLVNPRVSGWEDNSGDIHSAKFLCFKGAPAATGRTAPAGR